MPLYPPLSDRQKFILAVAKKEKTFQTKDIFAIIGEKFSISRLTVVRELSFLEKSGILEKSGRGRSVAYEISKRYLMLEKVDTKEYFSLPLSERKANPVFNDSIFSLLSEPIFSAEEMVDLKKN